MLIFLAAMRVSMDGLAYEEKYPVENKKAADNNKENDTYLLRPHHGLCLAFFKGMGYSDAFTVNMSSMLNLFLSGADVRLYIGADNICRACPNRILADDGINGLCISEKKIIKYDLAVLKACGFCEGDVISFSQFTRKVQDNIITAGKRADICSDCGWNSICNAAKSRWEI